MLTLRFETEDGCERDWKRQSLPPASGIHSLKRSRPRTVSSCSLECGTDKASLEGYCCTCGQKSNLCHVESPIEEDVKGDAFLPNYGCTLTSGALDFSFGGDFEADGEDFDLGPPPPSGPVLYEPKCRTALNQTVIQQLRPQPSGSFRASVKQVTASSSARSSSRKRHMVTEALTW
uniref:Uncharacterized protein n=1 Tax=Globisporangium ultimum (strain ATCC 200006 / CBS 805.95 / DAOM BR144) TaxID=431595 RepID=K3W657_GLOUD